MCDLVSPRKPIASHKLSHIVTQKVTAGVRAYTLFKAIGSAGAVPVIRTTPNRIIYLSLRYYKPEHQIY